MNFDYLVLKSAWDVTDWSQDIENAGGSVVSVVLEQDQEGKAWYVFFKFEDYHKDDMKVIQDRSRRIK